MEGPGSQPEERGLDRPDGERDGTPILGISIAIGGVLGAGSPRLREERRDVAHICDGFVVEDNSNISVLKKRMGRKDRVVWLNNGS